MSEKFTRKSSARDSKMGTGVFGLLATARRMMEYFALLNASKRVAGVAGLAAISGSNVFSHANCASRSGVVVISVASAA